MQVVSSLATRCSSGFSCAAARHAATSAAPLALGVQRQRQRPSAGFTGSSAGRAATRQRSGLQPVAAIKAVEWFDGTFELTEEQSSTLNELLYSELFSQQVVRDCKLPEGTAVAFTGVLFQPRPWTPTETKGMPADVEKQYYGKPEEYTFINVPPVFMFQAKIFAPPRLCAVYKRV